MGKAVENLGKTVTQVANVMFERQVEENKILQQIAEKEQQRRQALQVMAIKNKITDFNIAVGQKRNEFDYVKPDGSYAVFDYGPFYEQEAAKFRSENIDTIQDEKVQLAALETFSSQRNQELSNHSSWAVTKNADYQKRVVDDSLAALKYRVGKKVQDTNLEGDAFLEIIADINETIAAIENVAPAPTHIKIQRLQDIFSTTIERMQSVNPEMALEVLKEFETEIDSTWALSKRKELEVRRAGQSQSLALASLQSAGDLTTARNLTQNPQWLEKQNITPEQANSVYKLHEERFADFIFSQAVKFTNQEAALEYASDGKHGFSAAGSDSLVSRVNNHFQRIKTAQENEQKRVGEELTKAVATAMSNNEVPSIEQVQQLADKVPAEDYTNALDAIKNFSDWPKYSNPEIYTALATVVYDKGISSAILKAKADGHLSESDFKYLVNKNATQENLRLKAEQDKANKTEEGKKREEERLFNEAHKYWDKWLQDKLKKNSIIARSELLEAIRDRSVTTIEGIQAKAIVLASGKTAKNILSGEEKAVKKEIGGIKITDTYRGLAQTVFTQMGVEIPNDYALIDMKRAGVTDGHLRQFSLEVQKSQKNQPVSPKFLLSTQLAIDANDGEVDESRAWEILDWYSKPFNELVMHASDADLLLLKQAFPGLNLRTGNIERQ